MSSNPTPIIVYARHSYCPDVARTRARLSELGLSWTEYDIEASEEYARGLKALSGKRRVPTVILDDVILIEPSNEDLDAALQAAGHAVEPALSHAQ